MDVTVESKTATIEGARFHALWLRDNCPCSECCHESGQRLLDTRSLPDDLAIVAVEGRTVSFSDGLVSTFDAGWLRANAGEAPPRPRTLWGAELQEELRVAQDLPRDDFELLARTPIRFRYADSKTELAAEVPVISLDARGDVQAVHYNTRSAQAFRLPEHVVAIYYDAYQRFGRMLEAPQYRIQFKLAAGDLFIVDNLRVLHGRTGYAATGGERHLQGCYADRDGLRSRLAVLSR